MADRLTEATDLAGPIQDVLAEDCVAIELHLEYLEATALGVLVADETEVRRRLGHIVHFIVSGFAPHLTVVAGLTYPVPEGHQRRGRETADRQKILCLTEELAELSTAQLDAHHRRRILAALRAVYSVIHGHLAALGPHLISRASNHATSAPEAILAWYAGPHAEEMPWPSSSGGHRP